MRSILLASCLALVLAGLTDTVVGQQWNRFRGPNGSGISEATSVPIRWSEKDYNWTVQLPGSGLSSPVSWDGLLFVTSADMLAGERYLLCIQSDNGTVIWKKVFPFDEYKRNKRNSFASHTPAVDAKQVYTIWQSTRGSVLVAMDHDGEKTWEFELGGFSGGHGPATSPIVHDDLVIISNDQEGKNGESFLVAVDAESGKPRWRIDRASDRACYSTPCVYQQAGQPDTIVFTHSYRGITGVDASSGTRLWELDVFGTHNQRAIGSPVIAGKLVIGSSGFTTGIKNVVAIDPDRAGKNEVAKEVYRVDKSVPHIPTPLVYDGRLFLWSDIGVLSCLDAQTGKQHWQGRVGGNYFGSPVCVGGHLYCIDQDGVVVVVDARATGLKVLARNELGEASSATPAVSNGRMYLRTNSRLYSLGGKKQESKK